MRLFICALGLTISCIVSTVNASPFPSDFKFKRFSSLLATQGTSPLAGTYEVVGKSGVSAQMMMWGKGTKVYILDKAENNALQVAGHAAWGVEYDIDTNEFRAMDVITNTFCAAGGKLGDGTLVMVGGNKAVTSGNNAASGTNNTYDDKDGGSSIRTLTPCTDESCEWVDESKSMLKRRWYPTVEGLPDGSLFIAGGTEFGQWNNEEQFASNSYEFYPSTGQVVDSPFLEKNMPTNMFPLVFLMPTGRLFMVANYGSMLYDYTTNVETYLPDMPQTPRNYPTTGAATILPLTPANNYTATVLFCGGSSLTATQWNTLYPDSLVPSGFTPNTTTSSSCVRISPESDNPQYVNDDDLPTGRVMGQFVHLPDGTIWLGNGAGTGLAGYGSDTWAMGHSYSNNPTYQPLIYDANAAAGSRFSDEGLSPSTIERLYHSSAVLLPDGSILISGSNPNTDVFLAPFHWPTRYDVERWYPTWWGATRPSPTGWPTHIGYGAVTFNLTFSVANDLSGDVSNLDTLAIRLIRPGFSTHSVGMSHRVVELRTTFSVQATGETVQVYVQGVPTANIFSPGSAFAFAVINGIPSIGAELLVGNGVVETQTVVR